MGISLLLFRAVEGLPVGEGMPLSYTFNGQFPSYCTRAVESLTDGEGDAQFFK